MFLSIFFILTTSLACFAQDTCRTNTGESGTCDNISKCNYLLQILQSVRAGTAPSGTTDILRKALCGFSNSIPLVCCPNSGNGGSVVLPSTSVPINSKNNNNNNNINNNNVNRGANLLPQDCGKTVLSDRIIAGEDAPLGEWPWMVVLAGTAQPTRLRVWFCGGVLINDRYVLTAAHCFRSSGIKMDFARIGEHTISTDLDCDPTTFECAPQVQDIPVEKVIRHPEYNSNCRECNDIALLRLTRPAVLDGRGFVRPICLPRDPERQMGYSVRQFQGKIARAAGWGTIERDPSLITRPDILQQVELPIQSLDFCQKLRKSYPDSNMIICAGGEGKDTCRGDSGGPLVLSNNFDTKRFIVGITSLGPTICGAANTQGLYTSINFYVPWILSQLQP